MSCSLCQQQSFAPVKARQQRDRDCTSVMCVGRPAGVLLLMDFQLEISAAMSFN